MAKLKKEVSTKAVAPEKTTAETAQELLKAMFQAKKALKDAQLSLDTFVASNEAELFAKSNKYTVRYGSIERVQTSKLSFEDGFKLSFDSLVKAQKSPKIGKYIKGVFSKTAIENIIEKAKIQKDIESLDRDDDKDSATLDTIETMLGINGFTIFDSYSYKEIEFED